MRIGRENGKSTNLSNEANKLRQMNSVQRLGACERRIFRESACTRFTEYLGEVVKAERGVEAVPFPRRAGGVQQALIDCNCNDKALIAAERLAQPLCYRFHPRCSRQTRWPCAAGAGAPTRAAPQARSRTCRIASECARRSGRRSRKRNGTATAFAVIPKSAQFKFGSDSISTAAQ